LLVDFAKTHSTPLIGLDYKDKPEAAQNWLKQFGDPYRLSVSDMKGQVGIDYGVYGVPETFVIDRAGVIRLKHIGPLTKEAIEKKIIPLIASLQS
jgi:cytochrome c biogenesis protein CcmG/thiol:disulfide interchange protein DsbE